MKTSITNYAKIPDSISLTEYVPFGNSYMRRNMKLLFVLCSTLVFLAGTVNVEPGSGNATATRAGRDWWSLQPVVRTALPKPDVNPIDAFILAKLETDGMCPAPSADKRTLARRVYFDLIGLPPTPQQLDAFLIDVSPQAYENLIDQLLASPQYGERWARHWLDVVRFAETDGYERDRLKEHIWRYRDWVIDAFNHDMPYSQFVCDQLAGDEVAYRGEQSLIATGMLRAGTWNDEPNDPADYLYERLEDLVHTTTSAFLGLTVKCARCHDHKFDPIPQKDYYRIASFFWAGYIGQANQGGPSQEQLGYPCIPVYGWTDKGQSVSPIRLLHNGERHQLGPEVDPGFLSAVSELDMPLTSPSKGSKTTTRRLQFAAWITDERNPLAARVFMNRIWQHHFGQGLVRTPNNFGFKSDPPTHPKLLDWLATEFMHPTCDNGKAWTIKRMHKLILLSLTYRMASWHPRGDEYSERDPLNRNWWKFNRRRLDAETMRDSMLAVSGELNPTMSGSSFYPRMSAEAMEGLSRKSGAWSESSREERMRRSIYMMTKRSRLLPLMTALDFTETTSSCAQRYVTTVVPQALALLNNQFVHARSNAMAKRLLTERGESPERIRQAWRLSFGRDPSQGELAAAMTHLREQETHFSRLHGASSGETSQEVNRNQLQLWLRADKDIETTEDKRVMRWGQFHQQKNEHRPILVKDAINGQPVLRFDGQRRFLESVTQFVNSQEFSIIAVVTDVASNHGHRDIISNWRRGLRHENSIFLGTTQNSIVRFTDSFASAGELLHRQQPLALTAISDVHHAAVYQNNQRMKKGPRLLDRKFEPPYVIGTQGDIDGEYWHGDIAEILVFNRALNEKERLNIWRYLASRYGLAEMTELNDPA
ncbi:TPA: DUF1549 domain-containing protein, partial [Candidatus Poribacteria bacterium]|nr:DUF1549 domain-containing protein [Candidatus Poribacteria bacterium]